MNLHQVWVCLGFVSRMLLSRSFIKFWFKLVVNLMWLLVKWSSIKFGFVSKMLLLKLWEAAITRTANRMLLPRLWEATITRTINRMLSPRSSIKFGFKLIVKLMRPPLKWSSIKFVFASRCRMLSQRFWEAAITRIANRMLHLKASSSLGLN